MQRQPFGALESIPTSKHPRQRTASLITAVITPGLLLVAGCGAPVTTGSSPASHGTNPSSHIAKSGNSTNTNHSASANNVSGPGSSPSANPSAANIVSVDMVSPKDGWATGTAGGQQALWRSTNGGTVWTRVPLPFQVSGKNGITLPLSPAGDSTLFVADATVGGVNTYVTTDGGKTWTLLGTASTSDTMVSYFHLVNGSAGWLVTDNGVAMHQSVYHLFHSNDGGKTWQLVAGTNPNGQLGSVPGYGDAVFSFSPSGVGWMTGPALVNGKGFLMRSTDGGKMWSSVPVPVPAADASTLVTTFRPTFSTSGSVSIPVEYQGQNQNSLVVLHVNSSGQAVATSAPLQTGKPVANDFLNPSDGWVTTAPWSPNQPQMWQTTNGGQSWSTLPAVSQMLGSDVQLQFVTPSIGFAFASNQTSFPPVLWETVDGGNTWRQQMIKVYVTGGPATPGQAPQPAPPQFTPAEIAFVSDKIGYLSGSFGNGEVDIGRVYKTTDGGQQWSEIYQGGNGAVSVDAVGSTLWVDVGLGAGTPGSKGTLLVSTDGGGHFTHLADKSLASLDFVSRTDGWAVTSSGMWDGKLLYTHDGGRTWSMQTLPAPASSAGSALPGAGGGSATSVSFADATHGMLLETGEPGAGQQPKGLLGTSDGGKTWHSIVNASMGSNGGSQRLSSAGYAEGIDVVPGQSAEAYIWESRGPLLMTSDGGQTWRPSNLTQPDVVEANWVSMLNAKDGYALVHDMFKNPGFVLERTTDGMKSWTAVHRWE